MIISPGWPNMPPNDIAFLISVEQRLEKDEKWWNKFAGWDDQQALVSCLPGRGVGGRQHSLGHGGQLRNEACHWHSTTMVL